MRARMFRLDILFAAIISFVICGLVSWLLVFKLGWRWTDWDDHAAPAFFSLTVYMALGNAILCGLVTPFLVMYRMGNEIATKTSPGR